MSWNAQVAPNRHVRAVVSFILRRGMLSDSPLRKLEIPDDFAGGGIVVAHDDAGRTFKIEITQVAGPE